MLPGAWAKLIEPFDRVRIINGTLASVSTFVIGDGEVGVDQVIGEVTVRDSAVIRSVNGAAFAYQFALAAVATKYAQVQLWNPTGSGNRLILKQAVGLISANCNHIHKWIDTKIVGTAPADWAVPKLAGVYQSVAELYKANANSPAPLGSGREFYRCYTAPSNTEVGMPFAENVVIPPGYGYVIHTDMAGTNFNGFIEWYEEPL